MKEIFDKVIDEIRGAWRFRWIALATSWAIALPAWIWLFMMPDMYEASARVFVDTRTTLSQVTQGMTVDSNIESQILRVRQSLIGGPELESVAEAAAVAPKPGATPQQRKEFYDAVRSRITITGSTTRESPTGGVFVISYQDTDRTRAIGLVDHLIHAFVNKAKGGKREGSEEAQKFLVEQLGEYEKRLGAAESRLADFKKSNVGLMPSNQGDYFSRLQAETDRVDKSRAALALAERRRDELQKQLRGEQPVLSGVPTANPGGTGNNDTASRIRETQSRLDEMLLRFTDKHPDVIALKETLAELQSRQANQIEAMRRGDAGAAAGIGLSANPVFQNIQLQLNNTGVEIATLRGEVGESERKIAELRKLVNTAPEVEAGLSRLNRDYEVTRAQYQALLERLERARLSEQAEANGLARFENIDPPAASFTPVAPRRKIMLIGILIMALGAGGGLAYLLHQLRPVFGSARQLQELTGRPVLGWVSMTWFEKHQSAMRRGIFVYAVAASLLVLTTGFIMVAQNRLLRLIH